jgi:hypothetical protein
MPYFLELGAGGQRYPQGKAIVVNTQTGKHHSSSPIPLVKAKAQMRLLESLEKPSKKNTEKTYQ